MSNFIASVQTVAITIGASATSNTATITSVDTTKSIVWFGGFTSAESSTIYQNVVSRIELTNATTVTAYRNTSTANTITVYGTVVTFVSSVINSIQAGTCAIATSTTSGTTTITSVNTSNAAVFYLGFTNNGSTTNSVNCVPSLVLTNGTTVTCTRNTSSASVSVTVGFVVVEFAAGVVNSIQKRAVTLSSANASDTDTITSVNTSNTILLYNGATTTNISYDVFFYNLQLTNSTTVTLARGSTPSNSRTVYYTVLELVGSKINPPQQGTLAMTNATSNNATITSVDTSKSVCNWTGFSSSLSSNSPTEAFAAAELTSATNVKSLVNTAAAGVTATIGYQIISDYVPAVVQTRDALWFGMTF